MGINAYRDGVTCDCPRMRYRLSSAVFGLTLAVGATLGGCSSPALAVTATSTVQPQPSAVAAPLIAEAPWMQIHVIDVGQGAATLLEFTCGAVLIDTGGERQPADHRAGHGERQDGTRAAGRH